MWSCLKECIELTSVEVSPGWGWPAMWCPGCSGCRGCRRCRRRRRACRRQARSWRARWDAWHPRGAAEPPTAPVFCGQPRPWNTGRGGRSRREAGAQASVWAQIQEGWGHDRVETRKEVLTNYIIFISRIKDQIKLKLIHRIVLYNNVRYKKIVLCKK